MIGINIAGKKFATFILVISSILSPIATKNRLPMPTDRATTSGTKIPARRLANATSIPWYIKTEPAENITPIPSPIESVMEEIPSRTPFVK